MMDSEVGEVEETTQAEGILPSSLPSNTNIESIHVCSVDESNPKVDLRSLCQEGQKEPEAEQAQKDKDTQDRESIQLLHSLLKQHKSVYRCVYFSVLSGLININWKR